jgi:hypothetical protein
LQLHFKAPNARPSIPKLSVNLENRQIRLNGGSEHRQHRDAPNARPKEFNTAQLARGTDGLTGSEIEAVFVEALYQAFDDGQEPTDLAVAGVLTEFVPLSKTMAELIAGLRSWAKGRARPTAALVVAAEPRLRP